MKLIDELFKKYKLKKDSLIPYGFILDNNVYKYTKTIHNGSFELDLIVKDNIWVFKPQTRLEIWRKCKLTLKIHEF